MFKQELIDAIADEIARHANGDRFIALSMQQDLAVAVSKAVNERVPAKRVHP